MKINPWQALLNVLIGLGIVYAIHAWILPHAFTEGSPNLVSDLEKFVMTLLSELLLVRRGEQILSGR